MKRSRFLEEQFIGVLREQQARATSHRRPATPNQSASKPRSMRTLGSTPSCIPTGRPHPRGCGVRPRLDCGPPEPEIIAALPQPDQPMAATVGMAEPSPRDIEPMNIGAPRQRGWLLLPPSAAIGLSGLERYIRRSKCANRSRLGHGLCRKVGLTDR